MLIQLRLGITSDFIYEKIRKYFAKESKPTIEGLQEELTSHLKIKGADIKSENIVSFLANNGYITISGSKIFASKAITYASSKDTSFTLGDNSESSPDKSSIKVGEKGHVKGSDGAGMEQDEDGNIKIRT